MARKKSELVEDPTAGLGDEKPVPSAEAKPYTKLVVLRAVTNCYVAGIYMEAEQTITLNPKDANEQRRNRSLEFVKEVETREGEPVIGVDPKLGPAPSAFKMIQPAPSV